MDRITKRLENEFFLELFCMAIPLKEEDYFEETYLQTIENALLEYQNSSHFAQQDIFTVYKLSHFLMDYKYTIPRLPFFFPLTIEKLMAVTCGEHVERESDTSLVIGRDDAKGWLSRHPLLGPYCYFQAKEEGLVSPAASYNQVFKEVHINNFGAYFDKKAPKIPAFEVSHDLCFLQKGYETSVLGAWFASRLTPFFDEQVIEEIFLVSLLKNVGEAALYFEMPLKDENLKTRRLLHLPKDEDGNDIVINDDLFITCVKHFSGVVSAQFAEKWGFSSRIVEGILEFARMKDMTKGIKSQYEELLRGVTLARLVVTTLYEISDPARIRSNKIRDDFIETILSMTTMLQFEPKQLRSIIKDFFTMYFDYPDNFLVWHVQRQ